MSISVAGRSTCHVERGMSPARNALRRRTTMRFMVMVKATKDSEAGVMPSEELLGAMGKFNEEMVKAGVMLDGNGLQPSSKGARVRFAGDKRTVDRRPVRGDQGAGRRLLDHPGQDRSPRRSSGSSAAPIRTTRTARSRSASSSSSRTSARARPSTTTAELDQIKSPRRMLDRIGAARDDSRARAARLSQPRQGDDNAIHVDGEVF